LQESNQLGKCIDKTIEHNWQVPFEKTMWMMALVWTKVLFWYKFCALFIQLMPAQVGDIVPLGLKQRQAMLYCK
jgi:hypothetical protein